ncbi:MAG: tRNA (N6-isopentenyl adenosine(37)-C2)-methylthiotransferase MiaB [Clostridia bacterium]|nr:tRNA (N6-isopentenyl adenosine(37)-C2)-methylthiotransferase MiaB [Clostridia bacterium]
MKKYLIHTYGCQMNVHESEKIAGILESKGYTETSDEKEADVIMFNTCCIRETAESKIMGHIGETKRLKARKPSLIVGVCGCMSQQKEVAEKLKKRYPFLDVIIGTSNLSELGEMIDRANVGKHCYEIGDRFCVDENVPVFRTSGTNAWVNIIYGCNNFCTYCIVPYVRGRERSRSKDVILSEVKQLVAEGYKEITLLGQNVDSYGKDLDKPCTFAELLYAIAEIDGKFRLRFVSSHPKDMSDECIAAIAASPKICNNIHLPVQAGSNSVLARMNRKYTREQYLDLVDRIRAKIPDVGITSDIMVGFAGETEEDFLQTLDLVEKARFSSLFSFVYSRRKGTVGYSMENQIDRATKRDRITRLIACQNKITKEISDTYTGKVMEILVEDTNPKYAGDVYCGRTDCGRLVNFKYTENVVGSFADVKIKEHRSATLWGDVVKLK